MSNSHIAITVPKFKEWDTRTVYDYVNQISDYESLEKLAIATNAARLALFKVNEQINKFERNEKAAKVQYDREFRRAYIGSMEKTDNMKRMRAALACEDLENLHLYATQVKEELVRMSFTLRTELQTLQSIGNNMRQQLKME
jgi:hypothetical protein